MTGTGAAAAAVKLDIWWTASLSSLPFSLSEGPFQPSLAPPSLPPPHFVPSGPQEGGRLEEMGGRRHDGYCEPSFNE